jgi:hypothetical protein
MGTGLSRELPAHYGELKAWPWSRVHSVVRAFQLQGELILTTKMVKALLNIPERHSHELMEGLVGLQRKKIDGIALMTVIIVVSSEGRATISERAHELFELLNFGGVGIGIYELAIVLYSASKGLSLLLGEAHKLSVEDPLMEKLASKIINEQSALKEKMTLGATEARLSEEDWMDWVEIFCANRTLLDIHATLMSGKYEADWK